jgi:TolA-binding protein
MLTGLLLLVMGKIVWVALLGTGAYLGFRYVRAQERRGNANELEELRSQVRQLQGEVDGLRGDLNRVQEGQDFTARLLSERSSKRE